MSHAAGLLKASEIRRFSDLAAATPGCISLTLGEPDAETPPEICRRLKEAVIFKETHYIPNAGVPALRQKVSESEKRRGLCYDPDEILMTAGATEAIFVALAGILNPGDEVIIPRPAFVLYEQIVRFLGGVPVFLKTRDSDFVPAASALADKITLKTKAVILNSPNNPTGCVYSQEALSEIEAVLHDRDIFVLCDEVYRDLCYEETVAPSYTAVSDQKEKWLMVESFSKSYAMTGWRVGYLMADRSLMPRLTLIHQYLVTSMPSLFSRACETALDTDLSEMRRAYRERRDYAYTRITQMGLSCARPQGAFYLFFSIEKLAVTSAEFCRIAIEKAKVALTPGYCFGQEGFVRLSFSCSPEKLRLGLDRLEALIATWEG